MADILQRDTSAADLLAMPVDSKRYELIHGELIEMSPTNAIHGVLAAELLVLIGAHVRTHRLGRVFAAETGFVLATNPDTVLAPDIAFVSAEHARPLTENFATVAPDLAVEVISPGNTAGEMIQKIELYFRAGTRQVWIIYPKPQTIYVYSSPTSVTVLSQTDTLAGGTVLPGFSLALVDFFSVLDI